MKESFTNRKMLHVVLHLLAWLVLIILPQLIINRYWGNNNFIDWRFYINAAIYGIIFYVNYIWLVPKFFFRKNKLPYFVFATIVIFIAYFIISFLSDLMHDQERDKQIAKVLEKLMEDEVVQRPPFRLIHIYYFILISAIITGFSIGLKVIEQHSKSEKRQKELEKEKLNSELAFLKNQVSPHFFFNTLNNIYSLIEINTNDAQEAVLKLSKLMRYLLYESEHGKTHLDNEIVFMKNYIDLMKLRLSSKVELLVDLPETDSNLEIPPLLFVPFVENAFKHGISYREKSFIHIFMKVEKDRIRFECINSQGQRTEKSHDENHSGIGLENVKKRLKLLYAAKHKLEITKSDTDFRILLEIEV
ncbi:histidine kinase [Prolixibacteraceae bacterium Z1-6]|uniref:Histidine kinase n=1 Tax=Draconibacterium aestuarii TaxID=2998507 RepID=A0A9X3F9F9_9BACT|nr:histidine kinase [Prolixibacteraceae bacterium Z1-6]